MTQTDTHQTSYHQVGEIFCTLAHAVAVFLSSHDSIQKKTHFCMTTHCQFRC